MNNDELAAPMCVSVTSEYPSAAGPSPIRKSAAERTKRPASRNDVTRFDDIYERHDATFVRARAPQSHNFGLSHLWRVKKCVIA